MLSRILLGHHTKHHEACFCKVAKVLPVRYLEVKYKLMKEYKAPLCHINRHTEFLGSTIHHIVLLVLVGCRNEILLQMVVCLLMDVVSNSVTSKLCPQCPNFFNPTFLQQCINKLIIECYTIWIKMSKSTSCRKKLITKVAFV